MPTVIDASVAAAWFLPDEEAPLADLVLRELPRTGGIVPDLFPHEIRNILISNERRGRIQPSDSAHFLVRLRDLRLERDNMQNEETVMALARKHSLTAYDAAYLETALRRGDPLATLDRALRSAGLAERIELVSLTS